MNAELTEIARRFVACPGWVWLPGMQIGVPEGGVLCRVGRYGYGWDDGALRAYPYAALPNLDDPVTAAGILPVVRRAWNRDLWVREDEEGGYTCEALCKSPALMSIERFGAGASELLALLAALEAAS